MKKRTGGTDIQARHDERRRKRIREQMIRRYTFFAVLAIIAVLIIMFFTPLFNVRNVEITGNAKLSSEEISVKLGDYTGRNLFSSRKRVIKSKLSEMAYIEKVTVKKKPIPPTIILEIEERTPAVQITDEETYVIVDVGGIVLERLSEKLEGVPVCNGINIAAANDGELLAMKDEETQKIIMSCIESMKKADILNDITVMSFEDMTNITFNYQSRLDAVCGTHIDFQRKLALFKEAVNSNKLTQNSRGTINLSTTGKAIYTP